MYIELVVALTIAIPVALTITQVIMLVTERHNRAVERWEYFCQLKKPSQSREPELVQNERG